MLKTKVELKEGYALVEFTGIMEITSIKERFKEIFQIKDYWDINILWYFNTDSINLSMEDFIEINKFVTSHYPEKVKREKSAFIFNSFFDKSLGDLFVKGLEGVPYEVMVHEDLELAERWITSNN